MSKTVVATLCGHVTEPVFIDGEYRAPRRCFTCFEKRHEGEPPIEVLENMPDALDALGRLGSLILKKVKSSSS